MALLLLAATACNALPAIDSDPDREVVTRSLIDDGGQSPPDGGASSGPPVTETKLATSGMTEWSMFGASLALSGDVLVSAAPAAIVDGDMYAGAVYVFHRDAATNQWLEHKQVLPHDTTAFFTFGQQIALNGDTLAATVPSGTLNGVVQESGVYLFGRHHGGADTWGGMLKLTDPIVAAGGVFASSVALAGDLLFVGAQGALGDDLVMIFERDRGGPNLWGKVATLAESELGAAGGIDEAFGRALAVDGDNLLVGAPPAFKDFFGDNDGSAYLYTRDAVDRDRWSFVTRLTAADVQDDYDGFGLDIALVGDTAVVSAVEAVGKDGVSETGAVYVFRRDGSVPSTWHQTVKLSADDGVEDDLFGSAVALSGDTLLIGAIGKDFNFNPRQGGAYVFQRSSAASDTWEQLALLNASDGLANDELGTAVALDGARSIVGVPRREGDGLPAGLHDFGGVYLYEIGDQAPPPVQCLPAFPATDTLPNGGGITSPSGVLLATAPGTVPAPLPIFIVDAQPPAEPLYAGATPLGPYTTIGAQCTTFAPVSSPFVLGLPVPEGADTSRLAVAVLVPGASILDATSTNRSWQRLTGVHDPARQLYLVTMAALTAGGNVVVLVDDSALGAAPIAAAARAGAGAPRFIVQCKGMDASLCRDEDKLRLERLFVDAYRAYKAEGFADPALPNAVPDLGPITQGGDVAVTFQHPALFGGIVIEPATVDCVNGHYSPDTKTISLCGDPQTQPAWYLEYMVWHELFHAVQFAYPNVPNGREAWVIEGTATTAAAWTGVMNRAEEANRLRRIDFSFTNEDDVLEYETQDFWVHLFTSVSPNAGGRRALPLGELVSFFERGATTEAVADRLENPPSLTYASLGLEYFAWAKNQVIEKDVTFVSPGAGPTDVLSEPCVLQRSNPRLVGEPGQRLPGFSYTPSRDHFKGAILGSLQSAVVRIHIPTLLFGVTVEVEGDSQLAYKVYLEGDPEDCRAVPHNQSRSFPRLEPDSIIHVLVSNTSHLANTALNYEIQVHRVD